MGRNGWNGGELAAVNVLINQWLEVKGIERQ
jgi:hypothetical protein